MPATLLLLLLTAYTYTKPTRSAFFLTLSCPALSLLRCLFLFSNDILTVRERSNSKTLSRLHLILPHTFFVFIIIIVITFLFTLLHFFKKLRTGFFGFDCVIVTKRQLEIFDSIVYPVRNIQTLKNPCESIIRNKK